MDNRLRCSVIVPTYNRRELLRHTLASLTMQSLPRDEFEVLVVDDGSSDGTAELVEEFEDLLDLRYFFQEDKGFRAAKARNVGIAHANAPVCVFLDSGILLHSDGLKEHVETHENAAGPIALTGYAYGMLPTLEDPTLIQREIDFADPDGSIERMDAAGLNDAREEFYELYGDDFGDEPAAWLVYWVGNASAGTAQLREVGMFDENFQNWGVEDVELGYRLHRAGARVMLNRRASSAHYPHGTDFEANMEVAGGNLAYMAQKFPTPIVELLAATPPEQHFELNNIIRERGIPRCADYLAASGQAGASAN